MPEHLSPETIEQFRRGALAPADLLSIDEHIAACETCRRYLAETEPLREAFLFLRADLRAAAREEPDHISYERLAAYVDNELEEIDREIVESHLESCAPCARDMQDLRAFKAVMSAYPAKAYAPAPPPTGRQKFRTLRHPMAVPLPLRAAGVGMAAALLVWAVLRPLQIRRFDPSGLPRSLPIVLEDGRGHIVTLDQQGNLRGLPSLARPLQQIVRTELETGQVTYPRWLADIQQGALRSGSRERVAFALRGPVGTAVQTDRPMFRWRPLSGATGYRVAVYDSEFHTVMSARLPGNAWTLPHALRRGRIYSWRVTPFREGQEIALPGTLAPEAKFRVLGRSEAAELEREKQRYGSSPLLLGTVYAQYALLDAAEQQFQALLHDNPRSSVARQLLDRVRSLRRPAAT